MVNKEQILNEHGDDWCAQCHQAGISAGKGPSEESNGSNAYWSAYIKKWDELCPEFNPITGRGYA